MRRLQVLLLAVSLFSNLISAQPDKAEQILRRYADAWRGAEEMELEMPVVLGFWVTGTDGGAFHVELTNSAATLHPDEPAQFDLGFELSIETLRRLDLGELNALTAMAQAQAEDPIPLVPRFPDDFEWTTEGRREFLQLSTHFWNREWPEIVAFGEDTSRFVHGGNTAILVYDIGIRSSWYQLKPGMHINADVEDQVNVFDSAVVVIRGEFSAVLGGARRQLSAGQAVFIPAGMSHEFFASDKQYGEFLLLMYGEGA